MAVELSKNPTVLVVNDTVFAHGGLLPTHGERRLDGCACGRGPARSGGARTGGLLPTRAGGANRSSSACFGGTGGRPAAHARGAGGTPLAIALQSLERHHQRVGHTGRPLAYRCAPAEMALAVESFSLRRPNSVCSLCACVVAAAAVAYGLEKLNKEVAAWMRGDKQADGSKAAPPFVAMG